MLKGRIYARLTYRKSGLLRFLGHLDVARALDRAIRRAKLPIEYSQGFSPHALISFATPLPVGMAGNAELCAVDLAADWSAGAIYKGLGRQLPPELGLVGVDVLPRGKRSPFADLVAADYEAAYAGVTVEQLQAAAAEVLAQDTLPVHRITKSRELDLDLRPRLGDLQVLQGRVLRMRVGMAEDNLAKPEEVAGLMAALLPPGAAVTCFTRTALWMRGEVGRKFKD